MSELQTIPFKIGDELNGKADLSILTLDIATILNIPAYRAGSGGSTRWVIKWGDDNQDETDVLRGVLLKVFYYWVRYPEGSDLGVPPEFISTDGPDDNPETTQRARLVMLADDANLPFVVDLAPTSLFALNQFTINVNQRKGVSLGNVVCEFGLTARKVEAQKGQNAGKTFSVGSLTAKPIGIVSPEVVEELTNGPRELVRDYAVAFKRDYERVIAGTSNAGIIDAPEQKDDPFASSGAKERPAPSKETSDDGAIDTGF